MKNELRRDEKVLHYVHQETLSFIQKNKLDDSGCDALNMSLDLKLDRSNISRILNTLWKQGSLLKIQGRPVLYLSIPALKETYPGSYIPSFIPTGQKISDYLKEPDHQETDARSDFSRMIGSNGSLRDQITKAKASVVYPPYGLHTLIVGPNGTGKTLFAECMARYAQSAQPKGKNIKVLTVKCRNDDHPERLESLLLSSSTAKKAQGITILEDIEKLPEDSIEFIGSIIASGYYPGQSFNDRSELKTMFICTANTNDDLATIDSISQCFPSVIHLLDINARGSYEKMELVLNCFAQEAARINKKISVSKDIIVVFTALAYHGNITEMQNQVRSICARAYLSTFSSNNGTVFVNIQHIPEELFAKIHSDSKETIKAVSLLSRMNSDYFTFDHQGISKEFDEFRSIPQVSAEHRLSQFVSEFNIDVSSLTNRNEYINENLSTLQNSGTVMLNALKKRINPDVLNSVTKILYQNDDYKVLRSHPELLYGILLHITNAVTRLQNSAERSEPPSSLPSAFKKLYPDEYRIAETIYFSLEDDFHFVKQPEEVDFLAEYLRAAKMYANHANVGILIISHGEHIASEIANYIHSSIHDKYYLDAIDFRESLQLNDCLELVCVKTETLNQGAGVLILTDMEPVTNISDYVYRETEIPVKTISPFSLKSVITAVNMSMHSSNDLETIATELTNNTRQQDYSQQIKNDFIRSITDRIIAKTVSFIDPYKAVKVLSKCLDDTLRDLNITYSNDIAVKYLCHGTNMLERVIKDQPLDNLKVNKYIAKSHELVDTITRDMDYAAKVFGIHFPQTEMVYVAEIFEPYLEIQPSIVA